VVFFFEITPFEKPHRLKKNERITIDTKTFEKYQKIGPDYLASSLPIFKKTR
jgi:hypothetical protein